MLLPRTAEFDAEREAYGLRFACEDCAHFDARGERCRHEWPNTTHRRDARVLAEGGRLVLDFCKEFELC